MKQVGRYELNTVSRHAISRKWKSALLTHGEWADRINDRNDDGFQDNALSKDIVVRSEWQYTGDRGLKGEYTVTAVSQEKEAGQLPLLDAGQGGLGMADKMIDRLWHRQDGVGLSGNEARSSLRQRRWGPRSDPFGPPELHADQQFACLNLLHQRRQGDDLVLGLRQSRPIRQTLVQDGTFPCRVAARRCAVRRPP